MSMLLAVVGFAAALGPFRQARRLATLSSPARLWAAGLTTAALLGLAALSGPLLDLAAVSPPTARIGAGLGLAATCLLRLIRPSLTLDEGLVDGIDQPFAAVVPATFPVLFQPIVAMMALAIGAERGAGLALLAVLPTMALWLAAMGRSAGDDPSPNGTPVWQPTATRLVALAGLPVSAALMIGGVFAL